MHHGEPEEPGVDEGEMLLDGEILEVGEAAQVEDEDMDDDADIERMVDDSVEEADGVDATEELGIAVSYENDDSSIDETVTWTGEFASVATRLRFVSAA